MQKNVLCLFALLAATGMLLGSARAEAQQLSPEQAETVRQLEKEAAALIPNSRTRFLEYIEPTIKDKDINPLLVGKHVVFSINWLEHIGTDKKLTQQQFEQWRENTDKLYECFEKLTGGPPKRGSKIFIDIEVGDNDKIAGYASTTYNRICFRENMIGVVWAQIRNGSWTQLMIHEAAHIFANGKGWEAEQESVAWFMTAYVYENVEAVWRNRTESRTACRQRQYDKAWSNYRESKEGSGTKMKVFAKEDGTVYDCYLFGLVGEVGWQPVERAIRSYNDNPPNYNSVPANNRQKTKARDFFERIAYFSGKPDVLRSLPDKGELLDEHFNVRIPQETTRLLATRLKTSPTAIPLPTTSPYQSPGRNIFDAAARGAVQDVEHFLKSGVDVNAKGDAGVTPLHLAAGHNPDATVLRHLIVQGADVNALDDAHRRPLLVANTPEKRAILRVNGAKEY